MVFSGLSQRLQGIVTRLKGKGRLSASDIKETLRDIKLALLEADVNYLVVKDFIERLEHRCQGADILQSLTPGQQVVKIVRDELTNLLGSSTSALSLAAGPSFYLLVGLQGAGKTTTTVKLAKSLIKKGKDPVVISLDTYRPAARQQLEIAAKAAGVASYRAKGGEEPVQLAKDALAWAGKSEHNCFLFDTAGRMHLDDVLMEELQKLKAIINPLESILVIDVMTGQDAVNIAQGFAQRCLVDSIILTKVASDTRGGAALSVRAITGKPIKYIGVGEKTEALEQFHPDRMASQILGMGDVLTLIEKAEAAFDLEQAAKMQQRLRKQQFSLEDFRQQLHQFTKMGSLAQIANLLPGGAKLGKLQLDEREISRFDAIISSMTPLERESPAIINGSRRKRIASGSGTSVQQVNRLLKQFSTLQRMMKQLDPQKLKRGKHPFPFKI